MKKLTVLVLAFSLLTGCFTLINFKKHPLSGVGGQQNKIVVTPGPAELSDDLFTTMIQNDKEFEKAINECSPGMEVKVFPAPLIPVMAAGGKLIFDFVVEERIKQLKKLKNAAKSEYSARTTLTSNEFRLSNCAILVRHKEDKKDEDDKAEAKDSKKKTEREKYEERLKEEGKTIDPICDKLGLIAIAKISKYKIGKDKDAFSKEAFWIEPTYVRACDALAVTEDQDPPKINLSIGLALKGVGNQRDSGLPGLFAIGEGAVSVKNVELGIAKGTKSYHCDADCPQSGLIPYPAMDKKDSLVSVAMSIVESGQVGIKFDQRIAEAEAIKEALGPAIEDSLKEALKD